MTGVLALKRAAAIRALDYVRDGMVLGLGTGSTSELFLTALAERVRAGLRVRGVPTSDRIAALARSQGVELTTLDDVPRVDLTVDGADEIDPRTLTLIKGRGGALLREKLVAIATVEELVVADERKLVHRLGEHQPVPVAVIPFGWSTTARRLTALGCDPKLRLATGGATPFISDDGLYILDCHFGPIGDPERLAHEIKSVGGVVEHGLFVGLARRAIIGRGDGVTILEPSEVRL